MSFTETVVVPSASVTVPFVALGTDVTVIVRVSFSRSTGAVI